MRMDGMGFGRMGRRVAIRIPVLAVLTLFAAQSAVAQLRPDAFALDKLGEKAKESVEINLDSNALQMVNGLFSSGQQKEGQESLAKLLAGLKGIQVRAYEFAGRDEYDVKILTSFASELRADNWSKLIDTRDRDESFELYAKQGANAGFVIVAAAPREVTVIHIDGQVNLADLSKLEGQFGIPSIPFLDGDKQQQKQQPRQQQRQDRKGKE